MTEGTLVLGTIERDMREGSSSRRCRGDGRLLCLGITRTILRDCYRVSAICGMIAA